MRKTGLRSGPLLAAAATLAVHSVVSAVYEMPGSFSKYTAAAEQYLAGELPVERLMDFSPFYFDLAVAVTRLFGRAGPVLLALQMLFVAGAAGFLAWLLVRRFGRAPAVAGVAVFLFDRHVLVYERVLEPEACLLFFVLGWIFFLECTAPAGESGGSSWLRPGVAGVFAGASLLARPTFLPLFLLVPLYFRLRGRERWIRHSLLFGGPIAAALALLLLRAAAATGDPWTPAMNPGTVFYEGNHPLSRGTSAVYPPSVLGLMEPQDTRPDAAHEYYRRVARAAEGEADLSISEVNAYWSRLALRFLEAEPVRSLGLLRDKFLHAFHDYRWHDVPPAWLYDQTLRLPFVSFAILAALGLPGMLSEAHRDRRGTTAVLFYGVAGLQTGVMMVFYVSARQRLILLPAMIYFALAGLEYLVRERRSFRRGGPFAALVSLLAVSLLLPNDAMRDDRYKKEGQALAQVRFQELSERARHQPMAELVELALEPFRHAPWVKLVPAYFPQEEASLDEALAELLAAESRPGVSAAFDRGVVFLRAGRLDDAEHIFETLDLAGRRVYRGGWHSSEPGFYLARIAALRGDRERAVRILEEVLAKRPGEPFVLADLLALTGDPRYREALTGGGLSLVGARFLAGRAFAHHGRAREAVAELRFVAERLPEFRTARIHLAAALGEDGRVDEGAALYLATVREEPDPVILSRRIRRLFRRWVELHPEDPQVRLFAGHVLHEHGYLSEALDVLEGIDPPPALAAKVAEEMRRVREALDIVRSRQPQG